MPLSLRLIAQFREEKEQMKFALTALIEDQVDNLFESFVERSQMIDNEDSAKLSPLMSSQPVSADDFKRYIEKYVKQKATSNDPVNKVREVPMTAFAILPDESNPGGYMLQAVGVPLPVPVASRNQQQSFHSVSNGNSNLPNSVVHSGTQTVRRNSRINRFNLQKQQIQTNLTTTIVPAQQQPFRKLTIQKYSKKKSKKLKVVVKTEDLTQSDNSVAMLTPESMANGNDSDNSNQKRNGNSNDNNANIGESQNGSVNNESDEDVKPLVGTFRSATRRNQYSDTLDNNRKRKTAGDANAENGDDSDTTEENEQAVVMREKRETIFVFDSEDEDVTPCNCSECKGGSNWTVIKQNSKNFTDDGDEIEEKPNIKQLNRQIQSYNDQQMSNSEQQQFTETSAASTTDRLQNLTTASSGTSTTDAIGKSINISMLRQTLNKKIVDSPTVGTQKSQATLQPMQNTLALSQPSQSFSSSFSTSTPGTTLATQQQATNANGAVPYNRKRYPQRCIVRRAGGFFCRRCEVFFKDKRDIRQHQTSVHGWGGARKKRSLTGETGGGYNGSNGPQLVSAGVQTGAPMFYKQQQPPLSTAAQQQNGFNQNVMNANVDAASNYGRSGTIILNTSYNSNSGNGSLNTSVSIPVIASVSQNTLNVDNTEETEYPRGSSAPPNLFFLSDSSSSSSYTPFTTSTISTSTSAVELTTMSTSVNYPHLISRSSSETDIYSAANAYSVGDSIPQQSQPQVISNNTTVFNQTPSNFLTGTSPQTSTTTSFVHRPAPPPPHLGRYYRINPPLPPHQRDEQAYYRCDICSITLSSPFNLQRHLFRHKGIKPYRCKWKDCVAIGSQKCDLVRHVRITHLKLPKTQREERLLNIACRYNPEDFIEEDPELIKIWRDAVPEKQ